MRRLRSTTIVVLTLTALLAFGLTLAGCGGTTTTTQAATTTTAATASSTTAPSATTTAAATGTTGAVAVSQWDLPFLVFLSGPYGGYGEQMQWAVTQGMNEINAAGGIAGKPVNVTFRDTALDPAKASAEMAKAIDAGSLTIMGPVAATEAEAAMPLAVNAGMFCLATGAGTDIQAKFAPWMVSIFSRMDLEVQPVVTAWAEKNPGMKKVAQFIWTQDPTWVGIAGYHTDTLKKLGITVTDIPIETGVDMSSFVVKAMADNPDGYIIVTNPPDAAKIAIELDKRGLKDHGKVMFFGTDDDPALFSTGGATIDGMYLYSNINQDSTEPRWQNLKKLYKEKTGIDRAGISVECFYDTLYLYKMGIEASGVTGDPAKLKEERLVLRDWFQNVKGFQSLMGPMDFVNGFAIRPVYLLQIKNGSTETVGTYTPVG
jgi:branched-chain amino acid transport system substrate-binding protein